MLVSVKFRKQIKKLRLSGKGTSSYGGWLGVEIGSGGGRWLLGWTVKGTVAGVGGGGSEGGSMEGESEREDWEKEK